MRFSRKGFFGRIPRIVLSTVTKFMKRKKIYYNEEKNVDELKKKTPRGTCRHTGTSWYGIKECCWVLILKERPPSPRHVFCVTLLK
jgi:hypothetical protein